MYFFLLFTRLVMIVFSAVLSLSYTSVVVTNSVYRGVLHGPIDIPFGAVLCRGQKHVHATASLWKRADSSIVSSIMAAALTAVSRGHGDAANGGFQSSQVAAIKRWRRSPLAKESSLSFLVGPCSSSPARK